MQAYTLVADKFNSIYLVKTKNLSNKNLTNKAIEYPKYLQEANIMHRKTIYSSYDYLLNDKYKIKINQKTLERVKNYFR